MLSGSFDGLVRVHGLKSGKLLKEFRGHASYVNSVAFTDDEAHVLSASSSGSIKVWDSKASECKHTFKPPPPVNPNRDDDDDAYQTGTVPAVFSAVPHPKNDAHIIVTSKSSARRRLLLRRRRRRDVLDQQNGAPAHHRRHRRLPSRRMDLRREREQRTVLFQH